MTLDDVLTVDPDHVVVATGSRWRADVFGRIHSESVALPETVVVTPDDIMAGNVPGGRVMIYDDDHYYMASVLARLLAES